MIWSVTIKTTPDKTKRWHWKPRLYLKWWLWKVTELVEVTGKEHFENDTEANTVL